MPSADDGANDYRKMTEGNRLRRMHSLAVTGLAAAILPLAGNGLAHLPAEDGKAASQTLPLRVFILMGQSNMVGMGDIGGRSSRWDEQFLDPVLSVYPGACSLETDYDSLTPIRIMTLPAFGGVRPTACPGS